MMTTVKLLLKYLSLFLITVVFSVVVAFTLFLKTGIPHSFVKDILVQELEKIFPWDIHVGKISGNLLTGIRLKQVSFSNHELFPGQTVLTIKKMDLKYSMLKAIRKAGDMAAATSEIHMQGVDMQVHRDDRDLWGVLLLMPPPPADGSLPPPPTFVGKILFDQLVLHYRDDIGWGQEPLQVPFTDRFVFESGYLDFSDLLKVDTHFLGLLESSQTVVRIDGHYSAYDGRADLRFLVKPDLDYWGSYVFPFEGFSLSDDFPLIQGHIVSKFPYPKGQLPYYYNLSIQPQSMTFKMPFLETPLESVQAHMSLLHGYIPKSGFSPTSS